MTRVSRERSDRGPKRSEYRAKRVPKEAKRSKSENQKIVVGIRERASSILFHHRLVNTTSTQELADQISESESKLESYRKVHEAIENEAQEAATKKQTMAAEIEQAKIDIRAMQQRHPAEEKERLEEADDMNSRVTSQQVKVRVLLRCAENS